MWKTQRVRTVAPIGKLVNLRYLSIANLKSDDNTLVPLCTYSKLEVFSAAKWWDAEALNEIERRNPSTTTVQFWGVRRVARPRATGSHVGVRTPHFCAVKVLAF